MDNDKRILPAGKLPPELLESLLTRHRPADPRVLIGPRVGTDAAAIDMGDSVLIAKTDPITFATDDVGWYLVNVNANDIACMGGTPKWLLVTALLPEHHTTPELVTSIFDSLGDACDAIGVTLVGGHTEITIGLDRPILVGQMLGETTHAELIDSASTQPGDAILLCKGIAIEGTALLAREAPASALRQLDSDLVARASNFLKEPGISVVHAARVIRESGATVRALHDPTEGGIASALRELASSVGLSAEIERDSILVYPETTALCKALNLDPLGLIASGGLLAVVPPDEVDRVLEACADYDIPCTRIGTFSSSGSDVHYYANGESAEFPSFEVDEIARYFAAQS